MTQGLSKYDAIAALLLEKGELQDALLRAFTYAGKKQGTVVNIWVNKCPNVPEVGGAVAKGKGASMSQCSAVDGAAANNQ